MDEIKMYLKKPYYIKPRQKAKITRILEDLNVIIETKQELLTLKKQIQC